MIRYRYIIGVNTMGLFSKTPEEKKLKELTGGFLLNDDFIEKLERNGIEHKFGYNIQSTLKDEIKKGRLSVDEIEPRLNFLIKQLSSIESEENHEDKVKITSPKQRTLKFLINQKHNLKTCPYCKRKILKTDSYCYKCGFSFTSNEDISQDESKSSNREIEDLEKSFDLRNSKEMDNRFKFAYVLYLDYLNKYNSIIPQKHISEFNVNLTDLENRAIADGYINNSFDLDNLTVKDLKSILKSNNLKVSGRKNELIERINDNIDLSSYRSGTISFEARRFINKNRHVFFYFNHSELKSLITVDKFDSLFSDVVKPTNKIASDKMIKYLTQEEYMAQSRWQIDQYKNILFVLSSFYEKANDLFHTTEIYIRLLLLDLNSFSQSLKKSEPQYATLNPVLIEKLKNILDMYSFDSTTLKAVFETSYMAIESLKPAISQEDSWIYILKLLNGEDISKVTNLIHRTYSNYY
ncbi:MAG: hypothetical protein IJQ68_07650 [Methanobrevibacter sp.]|uniref:SAP domain-containing protein n=1 Tax=Methanobrevibacter sp. TaxID=66852 RepID=UPI0025D4BDF0|nr:SAP domain-containing protein [Methanobrevibacter sp.]MBR0271844.1 hypothetical protein [Methanobrevibacter sp.]